jgi:phage anti-repressor protein
MSRKVIKTRLIYQYDKENKANFHLYIDNRRSVALIIKTEKGALLAGYYPGEISEKDLMLEQGLLISISNNESYKLNK